MGAILAFQIAWSRRVHSWTRRALGVFFLASVVIASKDAGASQMQLNGNYIFAPDNLTRFASFQVSASTNLTMLAFDPDLLNVSGIAVQGKYAYVISPDSKLIIFDVSSPNVLNYLSEPRTLNPPTDVTASGNFLSVASGTHGFETFDISEPGRPRSLGNASSQTGGFGVQTTNTLQFVAAGTSGLRIYTLTNESPDFVTNKITATPARKIRLGAIHAYVVCDGGRLEIINIQNFAAPSLVGTFVSAGNFSDLDVIGNVVVLANTNGSVLSLNVSNPAAPSLQGSNFVAGGAVSLRVAGERAFVRNGAGNIVSIILAGMSPAPPTIVEGFSETIELVGGSTTLGVVTVGSVPLQFQWRRNGVALTNNARFQGVNTPYLNIANLALADSGNYSVTVSNAYGSVVNSNALLVVPAGTPVLRSTTDVGGDALGLDISGNLAYVASGMNGIEILNIAYPRIPVRIDGVLAPPLVYSVRAVGNYVLTAVGAGGFRIYDTSVAGAVLPIGQTNTPGTAYNFDLAGGLVYLADGASGLQIISISDPTQLAIVGNYDTAGTAYGVAVSGGHAFVADGEGGLRILNITNPAAITQVGHYNSATDARNVKIVGNIAYVASGTNGLLLLNITNPAVPVLLGSHAVGQTVLDVEVVGNIAILAKGTFGLETVSITNPAAMIQLGVNTTLTNANALRIRDTTLGVADGINGVKFFEMLGVTSASPVVTATPTNLVLLPGENASFNVGVTGTAPLSYQWFKNGLPIFNNTNIAGTSSQTLNLSNVQFASSATYRVTVRNAWNISTSASAKLTVVPVGTPVQRFASGDTNDALNVQVVGQLAYVANRTAGLQISDCRNPNFPVKISQTTTAGLAQEVCVRGHYAYVAVWDAGLEIFDVSNPTNVVRLGGCNTPGLARSVHVVGTRAYISDMQGGLTCADVTDPANPQLISSTATTAPARGARVSGDHAYVAATGGGLEIYNVSDPLGMWRVSQLDTPGAAVSVSLSGNTAYIADYDYGVRIINISNPASPQLIGSYKTTNDTFQVQPLGARAYLAEGLARVESLDISNLAAPTLALQSVGASRVHGLHVIGKHAYIADRDIGFVISELLGLPPMPPQIIESPASITNIAGRKLVLSVGSEGTPPLAFQWFKDGSPLIANTNTLAVNQPHLQIPATTATNTGNYSVVVSSPYGSTTSAVATVTIAPYGTPIARGSLDTPGSGLATAVQGHLAFIADGAAGLRIVDVNNPDAPVHVASYMPTGFVHGVCLQTNLLYLALGTNGLEIVNISDPTTPVRVGGCDTPGTAFNVDVQSGIAFVADGATGLQMISVTNPASPVILASYDTPGIAYDVRISNQHAFIADGFSGLHIANVSTPASPLFVVAYETPGAATAVRIVGNRAYIADGTQGLFVLDVSDPASPSLLGNYSDGSNVIGLDVKGTLVMLANHIGGYLVLDATTPSNISLVGSNSTGGIALGANIVGHMAYLSSGTNGLRLVELSGVALLSPTFLAQPASLSVASNSVAHFYATVSGSTPLACRWFCNGQMLFDGGQFSGTTTGHLVVTNVASTNTGLYTLRVWNAAGVTDSFPAQLSLIGPLQTQINNAATGAVIALSSAVFNESVLLNKNITLVGAWWNKPALDANQQATVLRISPGVTVTLRGIALRRGRSTLGGAILNEGTLTLDHCLLTDNTAENGGAIANYGTLHLLESVISNNTASASGGGIFTAANAVTRITNSILTANIANDGGGFMSLGDTVISHSILSGNSAYGNGGGGARVTGGLARFINSTLSGNIANSGHGGGLRAEGGTVQIISSTVALNMSAISGGGVSSVSPASVQSLSSIDANNQSASAPDFGGVMSSLGWNLVQNTNGTILTGNTTGNRLGIDPLLQPLKDNGGATFTHKLAANSPAIDAGFATTNMTDQRGIRRPFDIPWAANSTNAADIGAFEYVEVRPYLITSNRTAAGFTLAWADNAVLQQAVSPDSGWTDQTNTSPLFVSTLINPKNFFRLRAMLPLPIITTNNQTTNGFELSWPDFGVLERAPTPNGPWEPVTATSPFYVNIILGQAEFFRLRVLEN